MSVNCAFYGSNSYYQTLKMLINHVSSDNGHGLLMYIETNGHRATHEETGFHVQTRAN